MDTAFPRQDTLFPAPRVEVAPGAVHIPEWLDREGQRALLDACRAWVRSAGGLRSPRMANGGVMSVRMACLGWHWSPYRYSRTVDDADGRPVAPFPEWLGDLAKQAVADAYGQPMPSERFAPDVALINWYDVNARMGMHVDRDERTPAPVVSFSLGDSCVFRFGNTSNRSRPWTDVALGSGDLFVFGGPSRLAYHGVPNVLAGTGDPSLGTGAGRYNVTIRESGIRSPDV